MSPARDRHLTAVATTLAWAQESAERGDYLDALKWIQTVEAIGDQLPPSYETKREAWLSALAQNRHERDRPRTGNPASDGGAAM